jgi:hypothetical protein
MPRMGTPRLKISGSQRGASCSYTLAGPPEKISPTATPEPIVPIRVLPQES